MDASTSKLTLQLRASSWQNVPSHLKESIIWNTTNAWRRMSSFLSWLTVSHSLDGHYHLQATSNLSLSKWYNFYPPPLSFLSCSSPSLGLLIHPPPCIHGTFFITCESSNHEPFLPKGPSRHWGKRRQVGRWWRDRTISSFKNHPIVANVM